MRAMYLVTRASRWCFREAASWEVTVRVWWVLLDEVVVILGRVRRAEVM